MTEYTPTNQLKRKRSLSSEASLVRRDFQLPPLEVHQLTMLIATYQGELEALKQYHGRCTDNAGSRGHLY